MGGGDLHLLTDHPLSAMLSLWASCQSNCRPWTTSGASVPGEPGASGSLAMAVTSRRRVTIQILHTKGISCDKKVKVLIIPPQEEDQYVPVLPATEAPGVTSLGVWE